MRIGMVSKAFKRRYSMQSSVYNSQNHDFFSDFRQNVMRSFHEQKSPAAYPPSKLRSERARLPFEVHLLGDVHLRFQLSWILPPFIQNPCTSKGRGLPSRQGIRTPTRYGCLAHSSCWVNRTRAAATIVLCCSLSTTRCVSKLQHGARWQGIVRTSLLPYPHSHLRCLLYH